MQAGTLRHLVTIQAPTFTPNAIGERVATWADVATVFAAIRPASAREVSYYSELRQQITHAVVMRYTSALTADCRLKFGARIFDVAGIVNDDERNRELRVLCYETEGA